MWRGEGKEENNNNFITDQLSSNRRQTKWKQTQNDQMRGADRMCETGKRK